MEAQNRAVQADPNKEVETEEVHESIDLDGLVSDEQMGQ